MIPNSYLKAVLDIWSERGEETICEIAGNCMAPMIREGDSLNIQHGIQNIHVGDVIVFGTPGNIVVNRVVHIVHKNGGRFFLVKGDGGSGLHPPLSENQILGKVVEVSGSNGHLRLNSAFWKAMNRLLSIRSYISTRELMADSPFWKAAHYLFVVRSKFLPQWFSIQLLLWRIIYLVYRIWSLMETKRGTQQ